MKIKRGSTSVRRLIFVGDSTSTTGAGLTGLVYNSAGLTAYYFAGDLSNEVQITLATATLGSYTSGGFVEVDATNMPGWYEVGIPDAALDGGNEVAIQFRGATNMVPVNIYIELDAVDYQSATNFGLSKFADIETDTQDIQSRLPASLNGGFMQAYVVGASNSGADTISSRIATNIVDGSYSWPAAVTVIQVGLATSAGVTAAFTEIKGATWDSGTDTLEAIRNASGGSSITITAGAANAPARSDDTNLIAFVDETISQALAIYEADGTTAKDMSGKTLTVVFENLETADIAVVLNANITVSGANNNTVTWAYPSAVTANVGTYRYALRDAAAPKTVYAQGLLFVKVAAAVDS